MSSMLLISSGASALNIGVPASSAVATRAPMSCVRMADDKVHTLCLCF